MPCLSEWWLAALAICPDTLPSWIFRMLPGTIGLVTDTTRIKEKKRNKGKEILEKDNKDEKQTAKER